MPGPLSGFRVLDLSAVVSGPLTGALLADQGADVIKVERPGGDIQRAVGSKRNGYSGFFHVLNRGKRSICLDMRQEDGVDIVKRLASESDVVIQNFRPGVVNRLGVDYDSLSQNNPGLVYLSISGFGQTGPRAGDRAYDPIIQAYSGITAVQGRIHREHPDVPEQVNMLLLDKLTAWTGHQAITAALLARSKSGRGQHVELAMLDVAISFIWSDVAADIILQDADEDRPPIGGSGTVGAYADGWGATMTLHQAEFEGMCRAYGLDHIADDERFSSLSKRGNNRRDLAILMQTEVVDAMAKLPIADAEKKLKEHDVPFAVVRKLTELFDDDQIKHNELLEEIEHPVAGLLRQARPAARFSDTPASAGAPAPTIGQHSDDILRELGMADATEGLRERGVVL
ncbi:MAG: CoA transferase [Pseudomonadaceae bacterium]|nr:CoA transferase [Pseudomonadaceae bacterium]